MDRSFAPVGLRRTFEGAEVQIAECVGLGDIVGGDPLPSERELATTMQISRQPLAAIGSADHERIDTVMGEHLAALEQTWEQQTDRVLVRPVPEFLRSVAARSNGQAFAFSAVASRQRRSR